MARALDAGSDDAFTGRTSELRGKETDPQPDRVGFKQVMSSLDVEEALANGLETTKTTPTRKDLLDEPDMPTVTIPCYLYDLLFGSRPKAYMAGQEDKKIRPDEDKSNICTDTGASICVTGSLENTTDVVEKLVRVEMAENGTSMKATHVCMKTYFLKNRSGEVVSLTVPALYVKSVNQDLLSGKACNKIGVRIILDEDPDISGLYPLDKEKQQYLEESIPFISEPTDFVLLKIEKMDRRKFHEQNGYGLWHRRLMHCTNQIIKQTIPFSKGLEKLADYKFDEHEMCPACMIGKSKMQNVPEPGKRATRPLGKVNFDLIVSTIPSIEGYYYGALFVDDHTGYKWLYGLKTKDEALDAAKRWMAEIADLREKYPLLVVMRDNAKENSSKAICDYFTSMGVKNYYSAGYEPWQDGLAEASIKSTIMLAKCGIADSGLGAPFWFSAMVNGKDCRNATYKHRIRNTPYGLLYGEKKDLSKFRPFGCRAYMHLAKARREKGKDAPRAVEAINLGFASDRNTSASKLYIPSTRQIIVTNQAVYDERFFPYRKEELIKQLDEGDDELDILYKASSPIKWLEYDPSMSLIKFTKVHMGSDKILILKSNVEENADRPGKLFQEPTGYHQLLWEGVDGRRS